MQPQLGQVSFSFEIHMFVSNKFCLVVIMIITKPDILLINTSISDEKETCPSCGCICPCDCTDCEECSPCKDH